MITPPRPHATLRVTLDSFIAHISVSPQVEDEYRLAVLLGIIVAFESLRDGMDDVEEQANALIEEVRGRIAA